MGGRTGLGGEEYKWLRVMSRRARHNTLGKKLVKKEG